MECGCRCSPHGTAITLKWVLLTYAALIGFLTLYTVTVKYNTGYRNIDYMLYALNQNASSEAINYVPGKKYQLHETDIKCQTQLLPVPTLKLAWKLLAYF